MARVFISFAIEDQILRGFLVGQKNNARTSIEFTDYSVKEPWDNNWKTNCRARIKMCAGMIGIITHNTPRADGQLWELKCAVDEGIPLMLIHGYSAPEKKINSLPSIIAGHSVHPWTETNIMSFLNRLG
jgi:hypothetical protein